MQYKYHCQHQARSFAKAILTVPKNYPLKKGLKNDFREHFAKLCELAKSIYLDIEKSSESYGIMLVDIESKDHNLARDGYRTIHRFCDTLSALFVCGELKNHVLKVSAEAFAKAIKKGHGAVSGPVPKYELILSRLRDFGFLISDFEGKPFSKKISFFTVEFPDDPKIIDTIKTYCECWDETKKDRKTIRINPNEFHHHYYRFDYKITADHEKITNEEWLKDEADYHNYSSEQKAFSLKFYEYSLKYKGIKFDGDYYYKSKRIARIVQMGYVALMDDSKFNLSIKLSKPDNYTDLINSLPKSIQTPFTKSNCNNCNFQGATEKHCKFRVYWTFQNKSHTGCAHACFFFDDFNKTNVQNYWKLLEMEYGLKR